MELHDTAMGRRLIEHTLPELVRQMSRLAAAAERLADLRAGRSLKLHDVTVFHSCPMTFPRTRLLSASRSLYWSG